MADDCNCYPLDDARLNCVEDRADGWTGMHERDAIDPESASLVAAPLMHARACSIRPCIALFTNRTATKTFLPQALRQDQGTRTPTEAAKR